MALKYHPQPGAIVICDFTGLNEPEMVKRRLSVVISPRFREREGLCAIVPLSATTPHKAMPYHYMLRTDPPLPPPYDKPMHWVKADMVYTMALGRLHLPFNGKDASGKRIYDARIISADELKAIHRCVLHGLGLGRLTDGV